MMPDPALPRKFRTFHVPALALWLQWIRSSRPLSPGRPSDYGRIPLTFDLQFFDNNLADVR